MSPDTGAAMPPHMLPFVEAAEQAADRRIFTDVHLGGSRLEPPEDRAARPARDGLYAASGVGRPGGPTGDVAIESPAGATLGDLWHPEVVRRLSAAGYQLNWVGQDAWMAGGIGRDPTPITESVIASIRAVYRRRTPSGTPHEARRLLWWIADHTGTDTEVVEDLRYRGATTLRLGDGDWCRWLYSDTGPVEGLITDLADFMPTLGWAPMPDRFGAVGAVGGTPIQVYRAEDAWWVQAGEMPAVRRDTRYYAIQEAYDLVHDLSA